MTHRRASRSTLSALIVALALVGCGDGRSGPDGPAAGEPDVETPGAADVAGGDARAALPADGEGPDGDAGEDVAIADPFDVQWSRADALGAARRGVTPPRVDTVQPGVISARGGALLVVEGDHLGDVQSAELGGVQASLTLVTDQRIELVAPPLVAGTPELALHLPKGTVRVFGAITVAPLDLLWTLAPPEAIAAPEATQVYAAVAFDVDTDGDLDLVLGTSEGLRVLLQGPPLTFTLARYLDPDDEGAPAPLAPGGVTAVRGMAVLGGDGSEAPLLVACTAGAQDFTMRGGATGLVPGPTLPPRPGACLDVARVPERASAPDEPALLALISEPGGGAAVLGYHRADGHFTLDTALLPSSEEAFYIGAVTSGDPDAALAFERLPDGAGGIGELRYELTELGPEAAFSVEVGPLPASPPSRLSFRLRGGEGLAEVRARIVDAEGQAFDSPPLLFDPGEWTLVNATGPMFWSLAGGALSEEPPALPLAKVGLVIATSAPLPLVGAVQTDDWAAHFAEHEPVVIEDFDARVARHVVPQGTALRAGDFDGDGQVDALVLRGGAGQGEGPWLLRTHGAPTAQGRALGAPPPAPWLERPLKPSGPGPFPAAAVVDADGDGALDLVLAAPGQDRLLLGDGWGQFVDGTQGGMPLDWSEGTSVQVADVDRDGAEDLVVGNTGNTDRLYLGRGDGRFVDATPTLGFDQLATAVIIVADLDGDGDDDVVSVPADGATPPRLRVAADRP